MSGPESTATNDEFLARGRLVAQFPKFDLGLPNGNLSHKSSLGAAAGGGHQPRRQIRSFAARAQKREESGH